MAEQDLPVLGQTFCFNRIQKRIWKVLCNFMCHTVELLLLPYVACNPDKAATSHTMLFSWRHIGVPRMYTNMAFSYWVLLISAKHFDEYL